MAAWCASNGADDGAASVIFEDASKTEDGVKMCEMTGVPREASEHEDDSNVTQTDGRVRASQGCGEHDGAIRMKIVRWRAIDVDEAHETAEAADDHRRPRSITP